MTGFAKSRSLFLGNMIVPKAFHFIFPLHLCLVIKQKGARALHTNTLYMEIGKLDLIFLKTSAVRLPALLWNIF